MRAEHAARDLGAPATPAAPGGVRAAASSALALAAVAYFFTGIDRYGQVSWGLPQPVFVVAAFTAAALVLAVTAPRQPMVLLRSPVTGWAVAFCAVTAAWAIGAGPTEEVVAELSSRCRSVAFVVALMLALDAPEARRAAALAVVASVVVASLLNVAELLSFVRFAELPELERVIGRPGGFYVNPNIAGLAIALGVAATLERVPSRARVPLCVLSAVGIAATFSRGAAACFVLALIVLSARGAFRSWQLLLAGVAIVFALLLAFQYASSHGLLNENTVARVRLAKDDSGRLDLARYAWAAFVRSPWTGEGLGFVRGGTGQPHNMLLYLAADQGFVGLLLFPALGLALVIRNRAALAFSAGFVLAGAFSHNLLEDRALLVLVALAAAGGAAARRAPGARLTWPPRRRAPTPGRAAGTAWARSTP